MKTYTEWVEVSAVTLAEAKELAKDLPEVVGVLELEYLEHVKKS